MSANAAIVATESEKLTLYSILHMFYETIIYFRNSPSKLSPFFTDELTLSISTIPPPRRCMAAEKLHLVRVLTS